MSCSVIVYSMVWLSGLYSLGPPSLSLDEALAKLENWRTEYDTDHFDEWIKTIETQGTRGDPLLFARLNAVMDDDGAPLPVRAQALLLSCKFADPGQAVQLVSQLREWADALPAHVDPTGDKAALTRAGLISLAVTKSLADLENALNSQEPLLALLVVAAKNPTISVVDPLYSAIANNPAPLEMRRKAALELIASQPNSLSCPEELRGLMGPETFPALRRLVRDSLETDDFHYRAASVLAHFGDEEILPALETAKVRLAAGKGRYAADYVAGYIWMIEIQHPPSRLCTYIASAEPMAARAWTMDRALELGVPREDIRNAVLQHVERLKADGIDSNDSRIAIVKHQALQRGILATSDLPDVDVSRFSSDE